MAKPTCSVPECMRPVRALGYCSGHYQRVKAHGDPMIDTPFRKVTTEIKECSVDVCHRRATHTGLCPGHNRRQRRGASIDVSLELLGMSGICVIEGCGRDAPNPLRNKASSGMCLPHRSRFLRGADMSKPLRENMTVAQHIEKYVDRSGGPEACWPYTGRLDKSGYGNFYAEGRHHPAHRAAYALEHGPESIPPRYQVDHTCHWKSRCTGSGDCVHRRCCNPAHLEAVTPREHARRTVWGSCDAGHPSTRQEYRAVRICHECGDGIEHPVDLASYGAWLIYQERHRRKDEDKS